MGGKNHSVVLHIVAAFSAGFLILHLFLNGGCTSRLDITRSVERINQESLIKIQRLKRENENLIIKCHQYNVQTKELLTENFALLAKVDKLKEELAKTRLTEQVE